MDERLKPFAEAVGEMCNEWAHLEGWVGRLFLSVGGWDYRLPNALLMVSCIDIRDQIRAAKLGAINLCQPGVLLDATVKSLDYVDADLRSVRNRFVHDIWAPAEDGVRAIKANLTPKAVNTPGSGLRYVQSLEQRYVAVDEVREVTSDIINERDYVSAIVGCFQNLEQTELLTRLLEPPQRLYLLRQQEKRRPSGKPAPTRKRQRKSSPP
jgi:hypothetical protein